MALIVMAAVSAVALTLPAEAKDVGKQQAAVVRDLLDCRSVSDATARLTCYDSKVATLASAEQSGDLLIADRAQVQEAKKATFGYTGLRIPFLGSDDSGLPKQIEAKLTGLRSAGYGKWEFTLDNGMRWRQTDDEPIDPRVGQSVIVKTAAMGSYLLKIGSRAARVVRTQ